MSPQQSKGKKEKKQKPKAFKIQVLNIKLLSNTRSGASAYLDIIKALHKDKIMVPIRGGKHGALRTQFITKIEGHTLVYGKFAKFTKIEGRDWINTANMEIENVDVPKDKYPNLVEGDYFFIPEAHRLAIIKTGRMSIGSAYNYFKEALSQVIHRDEQHEVIIEQSEDIFDRIFTATVIQSLRIQISYTNADILKGASKYMDAEIRKMQAKEITIGVVPDQRGNISLESEIIRGSLGVAKSNGEVKAVIRDQNNKKVTINTQQHPEVIDLTAENADSYGRVILMKILSIFR